jgi:hypothetical protein
MSEHILAHTHQVHKHQTHNNAASGWRIHCGIEVTELSTNKQHTHTHTLTSFLLSNRCGKAIEAFMLN